MADFRKISVLAALVLLLGVATTASAQVTAMTCVANAAVPPTLRSEGLTELVGDIVLSCSGGTSATTGNIPGKVNFTVFLNTNITSRLYGTDNNSEALLIVDEPGTTSNPAVLKSCDTYLTGCDVAAGVAAGQVTPYSGATGKPNVFRGIVNGNQVQFIGVPVDPPGTAGNRIFRFTNIRANASGISAGPSGTPGSIQALISASGSTSVPINNPTQIVGFVQPGLVFALRKRGDATSTPNTNTDIGFAQCSSLSRTSASNNFLLSFTEGFPGAFKLQGNTAQSIPGQIYNTESGFTSPSIASLGTGLPPGVAETPTRFKAIFNNIPAGVNVYASNDVFLATGSATPVARLVSGEAGAVIGTPIGNSDFSVPSGIGLPSSVKNLNGAQLAVVNGTATAVWEVTVANGLSTDQYLATVWFNYSANAAQNSPAPGSATVTGSFAPTPAGLGVSASSAATASQTLPIPRFIEGTNSRATLTVYTCRTNLLFPFVTNQAGFDTGLAIANTSLDTGLFLQNTPTQTGACNVFSFGDNAPASFSTGSVAPGKVWVDLASTRMPNFQGYVIAQCGFQYAHGFAFISDFGARNLAMGYLSLVIPEPGNAVRAADSGGERLDN